MREDTTQGENMRHYEIVLLIHPDQSEQVPAMLERYKDLVTAEKGLVHRVEDWGRRRLAYMINEVHKAHYVMLNVECGLETLRELEKNFKFNDSIVRSLVIRRDRAISEQSALAKAKAEEDRIEAEKQAAQNKPDTGGKPTPEPAKAADDAEPTADAEQAADAKPEQDAEPKQEAADAKSEPDAEPEPDAKPEQEAKSEQEAKPEPDAEPEQEAESEQDAEPEQKPETV